MCNLTTLSDKFKLIDESSVIIWDEAPMQQRWIMECVDRTLRALLKEPHKPFGGKNIIFVGDYRQVSCVIPRAGKTQIIERTFTNSALWGSDKIDVLKLVENERIKSMECTSSEEILRIEEFANLLLKIGEGRCPNYTYGGCDDLIKIPRELLSKSTEISGFVNEIYGDMENINVNIDETSDAETIDYSLLKNAILTPKNEHVRMINNTAIEAFPGQVIEYKSLNSVKDISHEGRYGIEFLESLKINGLPEHSLQIKVGAPVMVCRNIDPLVGVCNGTKGIVVKCFKHVIMIKFKDINGNPQSFMLHRIPLEPSDPQVPIKFIRRQFPIHLAFGMTINKSQGQTLNNVGVYLPEPVFGHGQLYVALSRVTHPDNIKLLIIDTQNQGRLELDDDDKDSVYTKNVVFAEILQSAGIIDKIVKQFANININNCDRRLDYEYDDMDQDSDDDSYYEEWIGGEKKTKICEQKLMYQDSDLYF